jgi:hypothetical protein
MTGFQCNFTNAVSTKKLATPKVPRRYVAVVTVLFTIFTNYRETHSCGPEQSNNFTWNYANCTYGPKQPFYWYQAERNNMLEGTYTPPLYLDLYNFLDGAQNDIYENTTDTGSSRTLRVMAAQPTQPTSPSSSQVTPHGASGTSSDASPPSQETQASSHNLTDPAVQPHEGASHTNAAVTTKPTEGGTEHHQPSQNHHQSGKCSTGPHR